MRCAARNPGAALSLSLFLSFERGVIGGASLQDKRLIHSSFFFFFFASDAASRTFLFSIVTSAARRATCQRAVVLLLARCLRRPSNSKGRLSRYPIRVVGACSIHIAMCTLKTARERRHLCSLPVRLSFQAHHKQYTYVRGRSICPF